MDAYMAKHGVNIEHKHYDPLTGKLTGHDHIVEGLPSKSGSSRVGVDPQL